MSTKVRDYGKLASQIIQELGGENNIINVSRCATRLRLNVQNEPAEAKDKISELPGVITVVEKGGQLQIVIGTNVDKVYDAFIQLVNVDKLQESGKKESILNRVIATMSAVFAPFVYILAAAGIIQGMLILIKLFAPSFGDTGTYQVFSFISWSPFVFLPVFIAVTASKHFKCNVYIAIACCAALVSPGWADIANFIKTGGSVDFIGIPLSETLYTSSVLPPLFLVWILSYLERFLEAKLPNVLRPLFVPLLCMLVMIPFTIALIGPITAGSANFIANSYNGLVNLAPALAGGLIGAVWEIFVIFGVHWGITPVVMANFEMHGHDSFQAFQTIAVVGQVGAAFGFYLKSKNREMKGISLSAFITGIFGITEPAIYGVNLRFKKPFIYGCISGMVGGIISGFFTPYYFAYAGLPGPLTIVNAISPEFPESIIGISIGCLIGFVGPIILMQLFGTGEKKQDSVAEADQASIVFESVDIKSPMVGQAISLTEVPDPAFAEKLMGEGVAIIPSENHVYAPFDGEVKVLFEQSKHAIGLVSNEGVELLIHVGIDTVSIQEPLFSYHVTLNQKVKQGDKLMTFDAEGIKAAGCPLITPVIVTNTHDYQVVEPKENISVNVDSTILVVKQ
ncbi:glucose PTS transporter subunit IIA [Utexia brackfieldae]|uniref:glucose PTS transporter subunit IIA n=1 Tax=Utexia brackfieldae TaxID=3074108 RepID=UPI00370D5504